MSQDIHSALDDCRSQAERLVEEIRRYRSSADLNQAAADSLESVGKALELAVKRIEPFSTQRMRQFQILVASLLGANLLCGIAILVTIVLRA